MTNPLTPYKGPLTPAEVAFGIAAAQANAQRLLDDAHLLFEAERYPSATALAVLAAEEWGKVIILKRMVLLTKESDLKAAWKEYRNHRAKNAGTIIPKHDRLDRNHCPRDLVRQRRRAGCPCCADRLRRNVSGQSDPH